MWLFRLLPLIFPLSLLWTLGLAQPLIQPSPLFSVLVPQWTGILDEAQRPMQTSGASAAPVDAYRQLLGKVCSEAQTARQATAKLIDVVAATERRLHLASAVGESSVHPAEAKLDLS